MKNAMKYKYNLTNAEADKKWLLINRSVNGTGRTIKFKINVVTKLRLLFGKEEKNKNGTVNGTGRTIKFKINVVTKLRLLFGKEEKNKNGTASESASENEEENDDNSAE